MITLSSDFGAPYPAAMKGVLLRGTEARLVDVAHDFPRQDVRGAAFWLREVLPYFPPAVHLVVVDPGVGTDRNALVIRSGEHALVGPDNGVLIPAARRLSDRRLEAFVIDESSPAIAARPAAETAESRSNTFDGRDVFAPAAALVHEAGVDSIDTLDSLSATAEYVEYALPEATVEGDYADGEVLVVDGFGNVITNVPGTYLDGRDAVRANGEYVPVGETFAAVPAGERVATVGSHGRVELDVNRGRGDEAFGLEAGDRVELEGKERET